MELVPFCTYTASVLKPDFVGDTPAGTRMIVGIRDARWEGAGFQAGQRGESAADWLLMAPDGTASPNVRMSLRTDDGAFVYVEYHGRADWSAGSGSAPVYISVGFEIEDERYAWMNKVQFVGKGGLADGGVRYDIYSLR
ncbi:uncharacterized protein DUF3237 [Jatrophihabitans sp. GAS493]|uniref:DUF3237 domain-containing protein n=1 Tax=Jatrophihabitans sp. GAS493 TaxID=1907575 RepID=UPI000BBF5BCA|nr:DUF3237 domain-containing protein [Jatrophihabitans sp. GAS493]SOD74675.1 uncharacterized protein DUF3237 [Jatrophihabitans sp. GAS493]